MVEVIKAGVTLDNWFHVFKCTGCSAKLRGTSEDLYVGMFGGINYDPDNEGSEQKYYMKCPICAECHIIKNKIPNHITIKARKAENR